MPGRKDTRIPMPQKSRFSRKTVIIIASAVIVLGGAGVAAAFAINNMNAAEAPQAEEQSAPKPTPTPTPTPTPAVVQAAAIAQGSALNWSVAPRTTLAGVLPRVGDAADGETSISIDAPVVPGPTTALASTVAVLPATEYTFSAQLRVPEEMPVDVPAEVRVGATVLPMPELDADWQEVSVDYTTGAAETAVDLSVVVNGAVRGLSVDSVSLVDEAGTEAVVNGSFEEIDAPNGIRNDSLILQQSTATLAVKLAPGAATWVARNTEGADVASGTATLTDRLTPVRLEGLAQGYYEVTVTDAAGGTIAAPVGLIDMPELYVPVDTRFGTHVHAAKEFARDATPSAAAVGIGLIRLGDNWQTTEPSRGQYFWNEPFAQAMGEATVNGMDKMIVVGRNNKAYDNGKPPRTDEGRAAYTRYAAALVEHYDLDAVEVYNEWNIPSFNGGCRTGTCYEPVLRAAFEGIKSVDPNMPVVGGVTGNFDRQFFLDLWAAGGMNYLDVVSYHPYTTMAAPETLAGQIAESESDMSGYGTPKPTWITEMGWSSKTGDVSLEGQGDMLVRSEITAFAHGVERYFWYDLVNDKVDRADHEGNFGLFTQRVDGLAAYPPKPAAFTQALLVSKLNGGGYVSADDVAGVLSYVFGTEGADETRVVWSIDGTTSADYAAVGTITATNTRGQTVTYEPVDGRVTVAVSAEPLILEGEFNADPAAPSPSPSASPSEGDETD